jgi:hypothetical protein
MALRPKAPADVLDYQIPLPAGVTLLAGETLTGATVTPSPAGLVVSSVTSSGTRLLAWLQGGATQTLYALVCAAATSQGRLLSWSTSIYVGPPGLDDPSAIAPIAPNT